MSFRHFLDIQKQRVKLFCLLVRPWGIQARHGMEAGGVIYAHKNAVKSKECILRTPTTCKHAYILPHNMYGDDGKQWLDSCSVIFSAVMYVFRHDEQGLGQQFYCIGPLWRVPMKIAQKSNTYICYRICLFVWQDTFKEGWVSNPVFLLGRWK